MTTFKLISGSFKGLLIVSVLTLCGETLGATSASAQAATPASPTPRYLAATVHALPGLQCKLYPAGAPASEGLPVFTDADGYAWFYAVKPISGDSVKTLTLDCTDTSGEAHPYTVDLTSPEVFAPHPINLANEPGKDRPALKGDPLSYTQLELIQDGYGLRPDPKNTEAYARWLAAATRPGRQLESPRPNLHPHTVTSGPGGPWTGSVMTGSPSYVSSEATFNVPGAVPGGDQTTSAWISIWNGIAGYGTGSGLIQGGVDLLTTPSTASYVSFREYCCGDPGNGNAGAFKPNSNDLIYSQEWYCDSAGNLNINGGYGCTFLFDENTGAIQSCTAANGSPCQSVPALPLCSVNPRATNCMTLGGAAEFIIENTSPQLKPPTTAFPDFSPVTMAGSAYSSKTGGYTQTISNDSSVHVLTDFTKDPTHIVVTLGTSDQTYFSIEPTQPSYPLYCHGPLTTSSGGTPTTPFKWASKGAGAAAPGAGECVWADRGPIPIEVKSGGNAILGFLNELANLPAGKYSEIGVYRDPSFNNDMMVTQIVGFVTPPFSAQPVLP
ncbi:MAG: G1 family glutamic endopeptidase [Xanthobacteraceae bacterium]